MRGGRKSAPRTRACKALGHIALRLRKWGAPPTKDIHSHFNAHPDRNKWYYTSPDHITNGHRHAAKTLESTTGISYKKLTARSLWPGGATALLCANVDRDAIMLLGRWKSDAMLRYLRIQAAVHAHEFSQRMLDSGSFPFVPANSQSGGLPQEAPAPVAELLAHDELYAD